MLIDASAGLTQDDLVIVQTLYQAGATAMVLISKADLFGVADWQRIIDYVKTNLRAPLQVEPPVHAISVVSADATLCDRWFESELRPLLAQHHQFLRASQKRKIGALREAVIGALERKLHFASGGISIDNGTPLHEAVEALRGGDRILERAQADAFFLTRKITKMQPEIIDAAAKEIANALLNSDAADAATIFAEALTRKLADPVASALRALEQTRDALAQAMQLSAAVSDHAVADELPKPAGMPALDVSEISKKVLIEKPPILSLFGKAALASHVRRKLENEFDRVLLEFLSLYANRLRRWMEQSIHGLRNAFAASADIRRAQFENPPLAGSENGSEIEDDLQILRSWDVNAPT